MSPTANPVTSSSGSASSGSSSPATSPATAVSTDPLASESTFLTLLVSQLQNQDPLNPTDSTQFVSQLTSYSQLEQLIDIDKNTTPAQATDGSTSTSSTNPTTGV